MTDLLLFCFFSSIAIVSLFLTAEDGVLGFLRRPFIVADDKLLMGSNSLFYRLIADISYPLIMCAKCMASFWGILFYLYWINDKSVIECLTCVLIISYFNRILLHFYYKIAN